MNIETGAEPAMAGSASGNLRAPMHRRYDHGGPLHRFAAIKPGNGVTLSAGHPALIEARTIFPTTVNPVGHRRVKRLLKSGVNSRKIGKTVTKGRWRGFPIFTLTLEERATCPRSCKAWASCYGNGMPYAQRLVAGPAFEAALWDELSAQQLQHPHGFVVRLHVLGDFYSLGYVALWERALAAFPALHVFGYTARDPASDDIGEAVGLIVDAHPARFAIRFSGWDGPTHGSVLVAAAGDTEHLICPAQQGRTSCCATCALCWHSDRTIAFLRH